MTAHRAVGQDGLWAFGRAFAQQHQVGADAAFQLTKNVPKALDGRWIAFHRSIVGAGQYQALVVGLASSNLTQPPPPPAAATTTAAEASPAKHLYEGDELDPAAALLLRVGGGHGRRRAQQQWQLSHHRAMAAAAEGGRNAVAAAVEVLPQEAAVLTLGALLGLRPADFLQYQGLVMQRPPPGRGGPTSVEGAPSPGAGAGVTTSQWRDVTITASAAEDLQPLFDVRREGWLGADVATSFRLPPRPRADAPEAEAEAAGRYLWLFGDTLVGRASPTKRRRGAYFIHNSVAVLPAHTNGNASLPPSPGDVAFAWNVSEGGCPASVFVRKHLDDECAHQEEYLWPISGISASYGGQARVVVLAVRWAYTTPPGAAGGVDLFSDDAFNFKILGTTVIVVDNPLEEPRRWRYRQKVCVCGGGGGGRRASVGLLLLFWDCAIRLDLTEPKPTPPPPPPTTTGHSGHGREPELVLGAAPRGKGRGGGYGPRRPRVPLRGQHHRRAGHPAAAVAVRDAGARADREPRGPELRTDGGLGHPPRGPAREARGRPLRARPADAAAARRQRQRRRRGGQGALGAVPRVFAAGDVGSPARLPRLL